MNRIVLLLPIVLFFATLQGLQAQVVVIPDTNFLDALIAEGVDTNNDSLIEYSEAQAVTSLDVSYMQINDLTGIWAFSALDSLNCNNNSLDSLDVSLNMALTWLNCTNNQLASLNVSTNEALVYLYCSNNSLDSLDLSINTALFRLECYVNSLTSLNLSNNTALTYLNCDYNQLSSLDVSHNTSLNTLDCYGNSLTTLDVSKNTALLELNCDYNSLTMLDVSHNTNLTTLICGYNPLTSLNLSTNANLVSLDCVNDSLTSLDVSNNTNLTSLDCVNNPHLSQICLNATQLGDTTDVLAWNKDSTASWNGNCVTGLQNEQLPAVPKELLKVYTVTGQEINENLAYNGVFIFLYSDGTRQKMARGYYE